MHARGRKWWWTHERLRRAYFRLVRLNRAGVLFAFCDPAVLKGGPTAVGDQPAGGRRQRRGQARARPPPGIVGGAYETLPRMGGLHAHGAARPHGARHACTLEDEEGEAGRERRAHARHHDGRAGTDRRRRRLRERVRDQKGMGRAINLTMARGNRHTFLYLTPYDSVQVFIR